MSCKPSSKAFNNFAYRFFSPSTDSHGNNCIIVDGEFDDMREWFNAIGCPDPKPISWLPESKKCEEKCEYCKDGCKAPCNEPCFCKCHKPLTETHTVVAEDFGYCCDCRKEHNRVEPCEEPKPECRYISLCCDRDPCKCGKNDYGAGGLCKPEKPDYYTREEVDMELEAAKDYLENKDDAFRIDILDYLETKVERLHRGESAEIGQLRRKYL